MQILVAFFLVALVGCYGDESECEKKSKSCINDYMQSFEEFSTYRRCKGLIKLIGCAENTLELCVGEELGDIMKSSIVQLKEERDEQCSIQNSFSLLSEDDEIQKCFETNEEYIFDCTDDSLVEVFEAVENQTNAGNRKDRIKCRLFMATGECVFKRIGEKCGSSAAMEAMMKFSDIPDDVNEACLSIGIALQPGIRDEDKRQK